jgi:hypothetical protein
LQTGEATILQPPVDVIGYQLLGSARFSPTGDYEAFALAQGDPKHEQGWLDDQTLLVQSNAIGNPNIGSQLFSVNVDGQL